MAEAVSAAGAPRVSRLDRRKARTRQALIDAAVRLIAEGRGDRASIAEITEEADIGSFRPYSQGGVCSLQPVARVVPLIALQMDQRECHLGRAASRPGHPGAVLSRRTCLGG